MRQITVVDDELEILEIICQVLRDEGHEVVGIGHPNLVLSLHERLRPDLFLLDLMLPEMSGLELAQRLRTTGFVDTPMIALSASTSHVQQAVSSGLFQDGLTKPFDLLELVACVDRQLSDYGAA